MIEPERRKTILDLHENGMGVRKIASILKHSKATIAKIIRDKGAMPSTTRKDKIEVDEELLRRLHKECNGWGKRVHEKLVEEEGIEIEYSTLMRRLQELGLGRKQKRNERCDRVPDEPGAEMQHDTSPFSVRIGLAMVLVTASLIYLRYSKRRYLKFYRHFTRFEMKCFFHEALTFWGYSAPVCIIDNTHLARLITSGTGKHAVILPEMESFSGQYGFKFICHAQGHSNRKAGNERDFRTEETNFFPGRSFRDWKDLNRQAFEWSTVRMESRPLTKSRIIPAQFFEIERPYLNQVPSGLPAPYKFLDRVIDQYGYVAFNGNYYWVPGDDRGDVRVLQYADHLKIYSRLECLAEYDLPEPEVKNERFSPEGYPKPRYQPKNRKKPTVEEEKRLRAMAAVVGSYLDFALEHKGGNRKYRFIRELFRLSQQMSDELLIRTIERAMEYRITDPCTVQSIARLLMSEGLETMPYVDVNDDLEERDAYREGRLTDAPDLSVYDDLLEDDNG